MRILLFVIMLMFCTSDVWSNTEQSIGDTYSVPPKIMKKINKAVDDSLPKAFKEHAQYLKIYLFNPVHRFGLVDPYSAHPVCTLFIGTTEIKEADVLNMSAFRESPVFLAYLYRGDILKMDIQYATQFPELNNNVVRMGYLSYIIFPIVYNHERLIGFGVLNFSDDLRYTTLTESIVELSTELSILLNGM